MDEKELHDIVGFWSTIKLEIIEKYLPAYTTILSKQGASFRFIYIDAFAGSGTHIAKDSGEFIKGSPARALAITPPFNEYHFIDLDDRKIRSLEALALERPDVSVHHGDSNRILIEKIFPRCRYEDYARAVCFLDPYGLQLDWKVIETAGRLRTVETRSDSARIPPPSCVRAMRLFEHLCDGGSLGGSLPVHGRISLSPKPTAGVTKRGRSLARPQGIPIRF